MKRFQINLIHPQLHHAASLAESLLQPHSAMIKEIQYYNDWKYPPMIKGQELIERLLEQRDPIAVTVYRPFYWRSKVIAYFDGTKIAFNDRKVYKMQILELCGTLLHEYAHYCGFTHGNNFVTEHKKKFSVPYFLSENIERWIVK